MQSKNSSGIKPVEFNVLVDQGAISDKTKGGLVKPQDVIEREKHQQTRGVIVDMSPLAFNADVWPGDLPKPVAGQSIVFARHAGTFVEGLDGREYRVIKDKDVVAIVEAAA